jgi:hypothetical protein
VKDRNEIYFNKEKKKKNTIRTFLLQNDILGYSRKASKEESNISSNFRQNSRYFNIIKAIPQQRRIQAARLEIRRNFFSSAGSLEQCPRRDKTGKDCPGF